MYFYIPVAFSSIIFRGCGLCGALIKIAEILFHGKVSTVEIIK